MTAGYRCWRTDNDGKAVRNPGNCCYSWEVHDSLSGSCWRFTAPGCDVNTFPKGGWEVDLPTDDEMEHWALFLTLRASVKALKDKGRLPKVLHFPDRHYVIEQLGPTKWEMGRVVESARKVPR